MLQVTGAEKYYNQTTALHRVDFTLRRGEIVGLFGENGAGKTTLLKALAGLLRLNRGQVTLDGTAFAQKDYEKLAFITEEGSFFPDYTPRAHGEFYAAMLHKWNAQRYADLLAFFALPEKKARTFSRGQRAKLEIAVGMSRGADFILMDEPFLGKDLFTRRDFLQLMITMLNGEGVVIATHLITEIEWLITRAVVLSAGSVAADEPADAFAARGETLTDVIRRACDYDERRVLEFITKKEEA